MIYDPKEREIQAISYRDRVLQHSLCDNYLIPLLERKLIYDNVACRKDKGTVLACSRLSRFMTEYYKTNGDKGFFIKIDIKKYFNSIDHVILKEKLKEIVDDEKVLTLLFMIIDDYSFLPGVGLPMGNQSSQCFALLYLDCIDKYIKRNLKIKYYVRYMDDFVLLVQDRERACGCLNELAKKIAGLNIVPNSKSQIIPMKNGIGFLGWLFRFDKNGKIIRTLKRASGRRIWHKIKTNCFLVNSNKKSAAKLQLSMISYKGLCSIGMCKTFLFRLRKYVQNFI